MSYNVFCSCLFLLLFPSFMVIVPFNKNCMLQPWSFAYKSVLTQWKDVGQLWFWSSRSLVWVQTDQCEGGFAAERLLHLIPGCITQPVQSNSTQTWGLPLSSKDVEEYCIASYTTEVISLLQPNTAKSNLNIVLWVQTTCVWEYTKSRNVEALP